jgi:rod shape-determining protein MreC
MARLAALPAEVMNWGGELLQSSESLEQALRQKEQELLIYKGKLQQGVELAAENSRLRAMLSATEVLSARLLVSEVVAISPNPYRHVLTINRGSLDGVTVGQPVIDADGLVGQVADVFDRTSTVLAISDISHTLPVRSLRNGVRTVAEGSGDKNRLRLKFLSTTADIVIGDQLVSSGLGGRFPAGYPVGTVVSIERVSGRPFLDVEVRPAASIDRTHYLLLLFLDSSSPAAVEEG